MATGEVKGLKARGGLEIDMKWENNELIEAVVYSEHGVECKVRYKEKVITLNMKKGEKSILTVNDF